jgi:hypothetical protein
MDAMNEDVNWTELSRMADRIESDNRFNMSTYGGSAHGDDLCGAVACLAGHIVWANSEETFKQFLQAQYKFDVEFPHMFEIARGILNIDTEAASHLFVPHVMVIRDINKNKELVPAAIRWMVDNKCLRWDKAGDAVGFTWMMSSRSERAT